MKKWGAAAFTILFAAAMCLPAYALAENAGQTSGEAAISTEAHEQESTTILEGEVKDVAEQPRPLANMQTEAPAAPEAEATGEAGATGATGAAGATEANAEDPAADCYLTFYYYELVYYEDDEADNGKKLLGTYVVNNLKPGDVVNVWDYVFDIPGHFFFDGTAPSITISADNSKNVIDLTYGKLMNYEFTVNYYVMVGANLQATTWAGALNEDTIFHKLGEQTFVNQRFEQMVDGDEFEYSLDGLYVVDTYPQSITLTDDPDKNVLNVLYVPTMTKLPDDIEIIEKPSTPDGSIDAFVPGTGGTNNLSPAQPNAGDLLSFGSPYDPNQVEGVTITDGRLEATSVDGPLVFTDEMVANPVSQQTAERYAQAYELGVPLTSSLSLPVVDETMNIQVGIVLLLLLLAFLAACAYVFAREQQRR